MDLQLTGRRALVTGSTSGIGRGIATILGRERAEVVVHGRSADRAEESARIIRDAGGRAHVAIGDLATDDGAADVVRAVRDSVGEVDILVNNVGGLEATGGNALPSWFDVEPEHWAASMQQNVIAAVRMIRAFAPGMRDRGWGRVINIASGGATQPTVVVPEYCAAKAAVINMTLSLSKALARTGVTANSVSPGVTRTDMFEKILGNLAEANGWPDDYETRESLYMDLGRMPCTSSRYGRPEDIGALIAYLGSPLADFVNGANYRIDGGQCQSIN